MRLFAGLTGGIASGKSTVSALFETLGARIVDADIISREVVAKGTEGERRLLSAFPSAFKCGELDRAALRKLVFSDAAALQKLNAITHPLILQEAMRQAKLLSADIVVFAVPLLFESGMNKQTYPNVTVACDEKIRINRLMKRDNIDRALAEKMIAAQWTDESRAAASNFVIRNDGDLSLLKAEARRVYAALEEIAKREEPARIRNKT